MILPKTWYFGVKFEFVAINIVLDIWPNKTINRTHWWFSTTSILQFLNSEQNNNFENIKLPKGYKIRVVGNISSAGWPLCIQIFLSAILWSFLGPFFRALSHWWGERWVKKFNPPFNMFYRIEHIVFHCCVWNFTSCFSFYYSLRFEDTDLFQFWACLTWTWITIWLQRICWTSCAEYVLDINI